VSKLPRYYDEQLITHNYIYKGCDKNMKKHEVRLKTKLKVGLSTTHELTMGFQAKSYNINEALNIFPHHIAHFMQR
jgi:hypothetical protein